MTPKRPSPRRNRTAARGLMTFSSPTFSGRRREAASWPAASLPRRMPSGCLSSTSLPVPGGTSPPSGAVRNFLYRPTRSRVSSDQSAGRNNLRSATLGRPRLSGGSSMRQTPEHLRRDRDLHFCEQHSALPGFPNHPITVPSGRSTPGWISWSGIGHLAVGMAHQGSDLQLTHYDERGWRATFYSTGMEHSPTSAAWGALKNVET